MKKVDMTNVKEAGEFQRLPAGPYICKIMSVEDVSDKEYLKVTYDIAQGDYAGYYEKGRKEHPDWAWYGTYVKSYKTAALPMFKRFCSSVSKSNGSYIFDGNTINSDESTLKGKLIGLVFQDEEYYSNSGDIRTRLIVKSEFPIDALDSQKVPPVKKLKEEQATTASAADDGFMDIDGDADEVPFK